MATNPMLVPAALRYRKLRDFLTEYVDIIASLRDANSCSSGLGSFSFSSTLGWLMKPKT
jgi:hypothetical protein